jgi:nickel/cobalt transporter (NicO) family protein
VNFSPELLLIISVGVVGVLHTIVPDHWVPIALIARQRGWSRGETARAAFQAGVGHVVSTLVIASVIWFAGVAVAARFGHFIDTAASVALIGFGGWIAVAALRDLRAGAGHGHSHSHDFSFLGGEAFDVIAGFHGPELQRIDTGHGIVELSIFEDGVPPRFRLSGPAADAVQVETQREGGARQTFAFARQGEFWESVDEIPEPHAFDVAATLEHGDHDHTYSAHFAEHEHGDHGHGDGHDHTHEDETAPDDDPLYSPTRGGVAVLARHTHTHRHGGGSAHAHWHDHDAATAHAVTPALAASPPLHEHKHKTTTRTALLLILGSSPMVEGIPAFFAAGKYGFGVISAMALVFAASTIVTYVVLCVTSTVGLQRVNLGAFERYGEVLSGAFIALVGVAFWLWPVL